MVMNSSINQKQTDEATAIVSGLVSHENVMKPILNCTYVPQQKSVNDYIFQSFTLFRIARKWQSLLPYLQPI